jgi:hypothetical protein
MARELTSGFPLAAQIPEGFIRTVFAATFLRTLPKFTGSTTAGVLDVWFRRPTVHLIPNPNPFQNLIEVQLPLTARLSGRADETNATFTARPNLIQIEVPHNGQTLIAPVIDFRPSAANAFAVKADVKAFELVLLSTLSQTLKAISPIPAAPLFPDSGRKFFMRTFSTESGSSTANFLGIFLTGEPTIPPLPTNIDAHVTSNGKDAAVLVPRDVLDAQTAAGLASRGLGQLPAPLPGNDGYILNRLNIEFRAGHVHMTGSISGFDNVNFEAWLQLWANGNRIEVNVLRTRHNGGGLFNFVDFFSAGALTRLLEEVLPKAIGSVGAAAFGNAALFASDVPLERAGAAVRAFGNVGVSPAGLNVPVQLIDSTIPPATAPPYYRGHTVSREFHIASGCRFGDLIKHPRRFPTWQSAIRAGYNGCYTCQRDYNVVAAGNLRIRLARQGPRNNPTPKAELDLKLSSDVKRFGEPVGPLHEQPVAARMWTDENSGDIVTEAAINNLVSGIWTLTVTWDGWTVTGNVDIRRTWVDRDGNQQGERTRVAARHGASSFTVSYE